MEKEIQKLIDQHEAFKLKWLDLQAPDMFKWIELKETMKVRAIELKSQIVETKQQLDKDKWVRFLLLKSQVDENWKALTEKAIDSILRVEFEKREDEYNALGKYRELLVEYADNVIEYINVVKLQLKNDLPF